MTSVLFPILSLAVLAVANAAVAVSADVEIPAERIRVSTSSAQGGPQAPLRLIDGSGLRGDVHDASTNGATMWQTTERPSPSSVAGIESPAWVRFDFTSPQDVSAVTIWNHNREHGTDLGFRTTRLFGSTDGVAWRRLAAVELPRANGIEGAATEIAVSPKRPLQSVVIAADSNWGGTAYGLSEVRFSTRRRVTEADLSFPGDMACVARPVYGRRADGQPGREISLELRGDRLLGEARVDVTVDGRTERVALPSVAGGRSVCRVLLPPGAGVKQATQATLILRQGDRALTRTVFVPALRHWTVYLYNHAHVDIGYTAPQDTCELLHKRNIVEGIRLARATADYPGGARYRWNPEVTWPLERLWQGAAPAARDDILKAIRDGHLCVDASYAHFNTSIASDEELFQTFRFSRELQRLSGVPMDTFQQIDVPGMSWGMVPVMAHEGVRHVMVWPNTVRAGPSHAGIDGRPFWWVGPDGKSKVLFFQPGCYGNSGSMKKGGALGRPWFGQRDPDRMPAVIRTGTADVDFTDESVRQEQSRYPYDFLVLSWSLWDNCPLDADVPDAVRAWNEAYAFPRIVIAGAHEIMQSIERSHGDKFPVVTGDFTEYWTDGSGTAAGLAAVNRNARERLAQAETLWSMLRPGRPAPRAAFDEAWRYIALGSEHTWCAENPTEPFFQDAIWKAKQGYFREAADRTQALFDDSLAPATDTSRGALGPNEGPAQGGVAVFNTHSWPHGGLVLLSEAESARGDRVTDEQGKDVPAQRLSTGELAFLASEVPALGSRHYRVVAGRCPLPGTCMRVGTTLESQTLRVTLDPATGNITHLVDLASGRNFADARVNGGLNAFRWMPGDSDDAEADTEVSISMVESGPLVAELRVASKATGCRAVTRSVRLVHGLPWVEISNIVDKRPLAAKDGIHFGFGFDIPNATTRVDIPWSVMRVEKDQWPAGNRNWMALQRWLDISGDTHGITWCSLDAPLFEHGAMTANQTGGWSGERKPWIRKLEPSATVYSWAMNNHWFTNFPLTQDGPVVFRYRILPHGIYDAAAANRFGMEQAQPLAHVAANKNPALRPRVAVANPRVAATILKPGADGREVILRLRSLSDKPETVALAYPAGAPKSIRSGAASDPREFKAGDVIPLPPYGLLSLRLEF